MDHQDLSIVKSLSKTPSSRLEPQVTNTDAERLKELGFNSELDRSFSLPSLIGLCLCLMATWEACGSVIAQALVSGGAPCLLYNFISTFICTIAIGASLGEIASIYPTAGGQYHWATALFPQSGKQFVAWMTGWISIGGQLVLTASAAFTAGLITQGLIVLNAEGYVSERWHVVLIYWAFLVYATIVNIWGHRLLPTANLISGVLHIACFLAILCTLAATADKNTASFVFTEFSNQTGWQNDGVAWLIGLISTLYPFLGYDAACHLSEELPHAARNVPIAMLGSIILNGIIGVAYVFILLFSTSSLEAILDTPTGFPMIKIFLDATKSHAVATTFTLFPVIIAVAAVVAGFASTSRTLWAFARDDGAPFSTFFSQVDKTARVPVRAIILVLVLQMILGFIYLGNTTAFNAILSMAIIGMYLSYGLPIACMLFNGRKILSISEYGPFRLGKILGVVANAISLVWIIVAIVFSTFPSILPVTPANMNYSSVIIAGWVIFGFIYYIFAARRKFQMPLVRTNIVVGLPLAADIDA